MDQSADLKASVVERRLRGMIADGSWAIGTRLPAERELARQLGVARNTARRALSTLCEQGLLRAAVGRGTFVVGRVSEQYQAAVQSALRPVAPADTIEVRLLLEPSAAALAATRADADNYATIDAALQASIAARQFNAFEAADAALHAAIVDACRNRFLADLFRIVTSSRATPEWSARKRRAASPERRQQYDRQHRAIVAALHGRDVDAAFRSMQDHLRAVQASLLDAAPAADPSGRSQSDAFAPKTE